MTTTQHSTSVSGLSPEALISQLGLADTVVDEKALTNSVKRFAEQKIVLPTFAQLADPSKIPASNTAGVDKNAPDARNLFRVHWYNDMDGNRVSVPDYVVLPQALTGVESPIVVAFGDRFPMITAHKVLAAFSCFVPRVISGQFDPTRHRAVWPSTGNYARGGIAISRILGSRGVAVLPAGMSQERFDWLDKWVADPSDIVRTPGTESNVKEIYDACNEMAKDPGNFILNQFCEFGNHVGHYAVTGTALAHIYEHFRENSGNKNLRLAAFTSATGSAGTIAAGDKLKDVYGTKVVAVEALECPTMLENGFGEHNIHAICNVIAAIKTAKLLNYGPDDVLITIATDGGALYPSEREKTLARRFKNDFTAVDAAEVFGEHVGAIGTGAMIDCTERDRNRIFNLGYYTWVEQQGTPLDVFEARRSQSFWRHIRTYQPVWDNMITEFNARVAAQ
ncbi:MAG: pyridoxal-phosphate dependent enzyme [Actinobacteria bacterium]|nr:pyridoxal-phosphate dependent enzyme [Actinomycetota bacterium]